MSAPSEKEVAELARESLEREGWDVYPEANGFDLFGVARADMPAGVKRAEQLGVECKVKPNFALLRQILPEVHSWSLEERRGWSSRVNFLAVALWNSTREFDHLCAHLAVKRWLVGSDGFRIPAQRFRFPTSKPLPVPSLKVLVPAGVPSPQVFSEWKVSAVRAMLAFAAGERLTTRQVRERFAGVDTRTLRERGWIEPSGERRGRSFVWKLRFPYGFATVPPPHLAYPEIVEAIEREDAS